MKYIERLLLLIAAIVLAGTNKCQEDYFFAVQSRVELTVTGTITGTITGTVDPDETGTPEATETPEPTVTIDDGEPVTTNTPEDEPTIGTTPTVSSTPTITPTTAASALMQSRNASGLLTDLESLDNPDQPPAPSNSKQQGSALELGENWLGNMYNDDSTAADWNIDSDADGFADGLENALTSDPYAPLSTPVGLPRTSLLERLSKTDRDSDGLSDNQEQAQGTSFDVKDSDGDGVSDGLEFLSGSNAMNVNSLPLDTDGDGLSDDYELSEGINPRIIDTDSDGLSDGLEVEIGSNVLAKDTDLDGITDAREYQIGGDPLVSDFPKRQ